MRALNHTCEPTHRGIKKRPSFCRCREKRREKEKKKKKGNPAH